MTRTSCKVCGFVLPRRSTRVYCDEKCTAKAYRRRKATPLTVDIVPPRLCRHCRVRHVSRPRGLCRVCYYTPGVPALYPSASRYARRGSGNFCGNAPLPEPTKCAPGTAEKLAVMAERARLSLALFHPRDGRRDAT